LNNPEESLIVFNKDSPTTAGKVNKFVFTHFVIVTFSLKPYHVLSINRLDSGATEFGLEGLIPTMLFFHLILMLFPKQYILSSQGQT